MGNELAWRFHDQFTTSYAKTAEVRVPGFLKGFLSKTQPIQRATAATSMAAKAMHDEELVRAGKKKFAELSGAPTPNKTGWLTPPPNRAEVYRQRALARAKKPSF